MYVCAKSFSYMIVTNYNSSYIFFFQILCLTSYQRLQYIKKTYIWMPEHKVMSC